MSFKYVKSTCFNSINKKSCEKNILLKNIYSSCMLNDICRFLNAGLYEFL